MGTKSKQRDEALKTLCPIKTFLICRENKKQYVLQDVILLDATLI